MITLAACDNSEYTRAFGAALAKEARERGFSGCWGPIVDILHVEGPCSVCRKAGDTEEAVYKVTRDIFDAFASYNFQGTAKHYPGGQDSAVDTHMVEGISSFTEEELRDNDLMPYRRLIKDGLLPAIMRGHQVCPEIDELPASLSKRVIDIIRKCGFDGLIYTDSLAMMGILQKYGEKGAMARALMAGNDIILPNYRTPTREVYEMMLDAYRSGEITDERLDEAVRRVMRMEEWCARKPENPIPVSNNIEEILTSIVRDSITAEVKDEGDTHINPDKKRLFIVITPQSYNTDDIQNEISSGNWYDPLRVVKSIRERFPLSDIELIPEFPDAKDNERILNVATGYERVVFVSYCVTGAYTGTDCLTRRIEAMIESLAIPKKVEALVHFGNPLAVLKINRVPLKIYGYTAPEAQKYAIDALAGNIEARGKMPFPNLMKK